jgi:hypothetical protein
VQTRWHATACLLPARRSQHENPGGVGCNLILDVSLQPAASAKPAAPRLAQAKIRSDQLNTSERDVIADLFAVLESLVLRNELPAEAQGIYDQTVLMLARR